VYKYIEKADLVQHCSLLHKLGFPRWRHICSTQPIHVYYFKETCCYIYEEIK